jgi:acetylornithine deacetylase
VTDYDPIDFLERAVQTPSHEDVSAMRAVLVEELETHDASPTVDDAGNVLATRGDGDTHYVLNTHIDTVVPHVPFERDGETIRGRGACDAKGPLAALLGAFLTAETDARLTLAVTPDEETDSTGAAALDLTADGYIVGEPTGLDVCNAAKGRFEGTVRVGGTSAHAAEAASGVNAIVGAAPVIEALTTFDDATGTPAHETLGDPLLTPTKIDGGEAANQVPAACAITFDRRSVPPETSDGFLTALEGHLRGAAPADVTVDVSLVDRPAPYLEAFATPNDATLVETLAAESGGTVRPFTAATEASYFAADAPTVVFGPGVLADEDGAVAHAEREYVQASDVHRATAIVERTLEALPAVGR